MATWERANENLFSILFFTTERSANSVVKMHMGKTRKRGVGNGQAAWNALEEKYNSHTKEARRAYHEKLHSTKMKSGDDPDGFLYTMDGFRERLEDMGQTVPDERYEDITLQALPAEYERVRTANYERRDFHLADIRRMMSTLYIDCLSRPNSSPLIAGRGVAMQATGGDDSAIKCYYCGNPGHRQKNCVAWIAAQCKNRNQQTTRSTSLGRWIKKAGGDSKPMGCSFHKSTTHSDETCRTLQQQLGNNGSANCANQGSDYPAVLTASDPSPGSNIEEQGISFAAVEVPTKEEPASGRLVPPVKRLPRSTPAGFSAVLEAPPARTLKAQLSRSRKVRSRDWGFGTISLEGLQLSWACLEPFSTPPAKRPSTRERRHRGLGPTSLVPWQRWLVL